MGLLHHWDDDDDGDRDSEYLRESRRQRKIKEYWDDAPLGAPYRPDDSDFDRDGNLIWNSSEN